MIEAWWSPPPCLVRRFAAGQFQGGGLGSLEIAPFYWNVWHYGIKRRGYNLGERRCMGTMVLDFTALDFETVTSSDAAICAAGMAKVRSGIVVDLKKHE